MKFGIRIPSFKKRISARISPKRFIRHRLGLKMPRGAGFLTNPKKALYNKIYNKTSISVDRLAVKGSKTKNIVNATVSASILLPTIIIIFLLIVYWPLAIIYLFYKLIKSISKSQKNNREESENYSENSLVVNENENHLINTFNIPEPTKSLIFFTNDDLSNIKNPMSLGITLSFNLDEQKVETSFDDNKATMYAEPSLIWAKLPVKINDGLEDKPMYYPSYAGLLPECRYQYLNWLKDITQKTNLSYVFLYYYGLERHLLVGDYDLAVDEILRLVKYHDIGSFKFYAASSLTAASVIKKRADILEKAPFIIDQVSNIALYLLATIQKELTAKNLIELASRVKFYNRRYIRSDKELFEEELQKSIDQYHNENGFILSQIGEPAQEEETYFANLSIPDKVRRIKTPQILENEKFKQIIFDLLNQTHVRVKEIKQKIKK